MAWYCRTDGTEGKHPTREERDTAALHHLETDCVLAGVEYEGGTINQAAEVGHLLHVWRTPAYVGQYTPPPPPSEEALREIRDLMRKTETVRNSNAHTG